MATRTGGRARTVVVGVVVLAVVAAAVLLGVRWWREGHRGDLERALWMAPRDAVQLSWTDWAEVRAGLDLDLGDDPGEDEVAELLDRGFEADLTQTTALGDSAVAMQDVLGFSPATAEWELFSQSERGAVVMVGLPGAEAVEAVTAHLEDAGYTAPEEDGGVWDGGVDLLASLGGLTPELAYVVVDEERRLVLAGDERGYLAQAAEHARDGDGPEVDDLHDVVEAVGDPLAAAVYTGDHACAKLAMSQASEGDQDRAAALVARAGDLNPMTGFAIALGAAGEVRVAMSFESEEQARTNADARARLASGPAPGTAGDFTDLFELGEVSADGRTVTMELDPVEGSYAFSSLKDGPVLFATC